MNRRGSRRFVMATAAVGWLILPLVSTSTGSTADSEPEIPALAEVLAADFAVVTLEGETVALSTLVEPGHPLVVELWATWCAPCRKTIPHLDELEQRHGDEIGILGLTVEDPDEDREAVRKFIAEEGVGYDVAFAPDELFRFMNDRPDIAVLKLFVFDADGLLVRYIPRYSPLTPRKLRSAVLETLPAE